LGLFLALLDQLAVWSQALKAVRMTDVGLRRSMTDKDENRPGQ
jgi:hypothetical protein